MEDVVPELLDRIQSDFDKAVKKSDTIEKLMEKIESGQATYLEANEYAIEVGNILADAYKHNISSSVLPEGKMYYNIANRIIPPTMKKDFDLVSHVSEQIQESLNAAAGIGIKAIQPELNTDRINGIVNRVSIADNFDDISWILGEPVVNFSQNIVDDFIKVNSEFQGKAGMSPRIVRKLASGCCDWCREVAGTYSYPDVPEDVYRRHQRCRCTVEYDPGTGKRQNVHTKIWKTQEERDKIEMKKAFGIKSLPLSLSEHPMRLASYTPESLKKALEKEGFEVKTLKKGSLKNIPFEDGGGYKVNFEDGGIIQYHPEKQSHHEGAYYKISTGKGGTKRYELDGTEKKD